MTVYRLGDVDIGPQRIEGWIRRSTLQRITILGDGGSSRDEILQQGSQPARHATLQGMLTDYADVELLTAYERDHEPIDFYDPETDQTDEVVILELSVRRRFRDLWEYSLTIVRNPVLPTAPPFEPPPIPEEPPPPLVAGAVQWATTNGSGTLHAILPGGPPIEGNTLIMCATGRVHVPPLAAGWTNHPAGNLSITGGERGRMSYRVAEAGMSADFSSFDSDSRAITIIELANVDPTPDARGFDSGGVGGPNCLGTRTVKPGILTPTAATSAVIVGMASMSSVDYKVTTVEPSEGLTELADLRTKSNSAPHHWVALQEIAATAGSYDPSGVATNVCLWAGRSLVFRAAS